MKSDMEEGPIEKEELVARPPPGRVICWVNFGHWVPTGGIKDVLIGEYDYNYMFVVRHFSWITVNRASRDQLNNFGIRWCQDP